MEIKIDLFNFLFFSSFLSYQKHLRRIGFHSFSVGDGLGDDDDKFFDPKASQVCVLERVCIIPVALQGDR